MSIFLSGGMCSKYFAMVSGFSHKSDIGVTPSWNFVYVIFNSYFHACICFFDSGTFYSHVYHLLPSVYSARKPAELSQMCIALLAAESLDYFQPISYCSPCVANVSCRAVEQSAMFTEVGQK